MILLAGYFISVIGKNVGNLKTLILTALMFSWMGDVFLMFQQDNSIFFILGLASFLLAHVAYILSFKKFENAVSNKVAVIIALVFTAYSISLAILLWPGLGEMKLPVLVYAFVITAMGVVGFVKNWGVNKLIILGAVLFIISDSMIAYTKFVGPIELSRFSIMSTYILAQFLLIKGLSDRILATSKE